MSEVSAGELIHKVSFQKREEVDRGDGVFEGAWLEQFQTRAKYHFMRGGESVLAGRLQGTQTLVITVRSSEASRLATTDWAIRDERSGAWFNIREVTPHPNRQWLDFLCQSGVAP